MLSVVSGSLIEILVCSFVSSFGADRKGVSRFSSCISGPLWIGLFIYLFLRRVLADVAKKFLNLAGTAWQPKTRKSPVNHTTRLYGVQEAICIYWRDLDNMPGSRRGYLNPLEEDTEFMFLTNAISLWGTALAYASACAKPQLIDP